MMDARNQLTEAFDRGFESNGEALPHEIRDLYWIQYFLLNYEQGGWLYNWSTSMERFDATIPAMQRRGLLHLAEILSKVRTLLQPVTRICDEMDAAGREITWREMLKIIDPKNELDALQEAIDALPDYGLPERW